jgi:hypothetical protein
MSLGYVLGGDDGHTPIPCDNIFECVDAFAKERHVADDTIHDVRVSTVFLVYDHASFGEPPMLFETMTFGDEPWNNEYERCSTWAQAEAQHREMVDRVKAHFTPPPESPPRSA